jgi:hypothetical protein
MAWRVPLGASSPRTIQRRDVARYPPALAVFRDAAKRGRQAGRRSNSSHALVGVTAPLRHRYVYRAGQRATVDAGGTFKGMIASSDNGVLHDVFSLVRRRIISQPVVYINKEIH